MTNPNENPNGTDSVSQEQAFKDWTAAGNGVPLQYKGREHVWDRKVDASMKRGGEVHMAGAGAVKKAVKGAVEGVIEGIQKILPRAEADANKAKFLAESKDPRRMYHATASDFKQYLPSGSSRAVFVTPETKFAEDFARDNFTNTQGSQKFQTGSRTMPVRVQVKNPFDYEDPKQVENLKTLARKRFPGNEQVLAEIDALGLFEHNWPSVEHPDVQRLIKQAGHDAFYASERGTKNLGVYDPNRIKSDIGNRGTYDVTKGDINEAHGGAIHMADGGAAFGTFPQMKPKRSKQDAEAAKNVPVDLARGFASGVLGAPGDIESLVRMLPYLDEKTVFPTSEEIEKRMPFRSDTPVSRAAAGAGSLAGGFYAGPGSPLRVIGALPSALKHGAQEFAKASAAGVPHVIKPKGGNWLTGSVEKALKGLKSESNAGKDPSEVLKELNEKYTPETMQRLSPQLQDFVRETITDMQHKSALNKWVDSNLTNYVKKEMATPEDPVRKLAEEGISHMPENEINYANQWIPEELGLKRMNAGFPSTGLGKSNAARGWESITDDYIDVGAASQHTRPLTESEQRRGIRSTVDSNPWLTKVAPETKIYYPDFRESGISDTMSRDLGFDHIMDVLREDLAAGRIRPEQMNKISITDAVRRTHQYDWLTQRVSLMQRWKQVAKRITTKPQNFWGLKIQQVVTLPDLLQRVNCQVRRASPKSKANRTAHPMKSTCPTSKTL